MVAQQISGKRFVPFDWVEKKLQDVAPFQRGFDLTKSQLRSGNIPVVYSNGVGAYHSASMVKGPGVVTGRSGTIGNVHYVEEDYWPHNTSLWVTDFYTNHPKFIYYLYDFINLERFKSGTGVPTFNRNDAHEFKLIIPKSKEEQQAIAEALSDADALATSLEKLIEKKSLMQSGMMDKLLNKGLYKNEPTSWIEAKIGEFSSVVCGGTPSTLEPSYWNGNIPWMSSGELHNRYIHHVKETISEKGLSNSPAKLLPKNCVLVGLAGQGKTRGTTAINRIELATNQSIGAILPSANVVPEFLYFNLKNRYAELRGLSSGDGGRGGLNKSIIENISVALPQLEKQIEISQILKIIEDEITNLRHHLSKAKRVKAGMMKELLTGRIRLS